MGDLDTSLIQEFAMRPAFYNKTSPNYKDKLYVEKAWADISHKLGYDVTLLKDRMYQLRNRYNLEKRKVDAMKNEGNRNPKSTWPLFRHLTFLDGHIRPRKSYKSMMKRSLHEDDYPDTSLGPPMVEIKFERDEDVSEIFQNGYDTEDDTQTSLKNGEFVNPANFLDDTDSENDPHNDIQHTSKPTNNNNSTTNNTTSISLRNINSLKRSLHMDDLPIRPYKIPKVHHSSDKFDAFGTFVTASLLDLPENKALEIVEKFTNELVRALIEKP